MNGIEPLIYIADLVRFQARLIRLSFAILWTQLTKGV